MRRETVFLAVTPSLRLRIETTIENLLALLDEVDGDPDAEDGMMANRLSACRSTTPRPASWNMSWRTKATIGSQTSRTATLSFLAMARGR
jgi:hypothetical protein